MVKQQSWNNRIKAWVIYELVKNARGGTYAKIKNVKQKNKNIPFKGIKISPTSSRKS